MIDQIDKALFLFLNSFHNPLMDRVMWIVSGRFTWLPLYLLILVMVAMHTKRKIVVIFPLLILCVVITDQASVHLFKEVFERLRPCHEPSLEGLVHIVNGKCGGLYGFVSSHAANSFGLAVLSAEILKKKWFSCLIITWAVLVSYSRVYLGVHYPGDIVGGAMLGCLAGWLMFIIYRELDTRFLAGMNFFMKKN